MVLLVFDKFFHFLKIGCRICSKDKSLKPTLEQIYVAVCRDKE